MADVIVDADSEMVDRPRLARCEQGPQVIKHRLHHRRGELLRRQPIAAAQHGRERRRPVCGQPMHSCPLLRQGRHHIEVEGFAGGTGLLAAIEHGNGPGAGWQGLHQQAGRKRPKQAHLQHPHPLAGGLQRLSCFHGGLAARTHQHEHPLGIAGADVVVGAVVATGELAKARHRLNHMVWRGLHEAVHRFARLEINIRVLAGATDHRAVGAEGPGAVGTDRLLRDQLAQLGIAERRDLLDLVGGAEAIEHMQKRQPAAQAGPGGDGGEVARLLH